MILQEDYSWLTSCSLSQGVNKKRNLYLKAFENTNSLAMQGEMNFFIDSFLELINIGQSEIFDNLYNKTILLEAAYNFIKADERVTVDEKMFNIVYSAVQMYLLGIMIILNLKILKV